MSWTPRTFALSGGPAASCLQTKGFDRRREGTRLLPPARIVEKVAGERRAPVFELPLDQVAEGYRAMDERRAIKTLLRP
jgi:hypothetical protein